MITEDCMEIFLSFTGEWTKASPSPPPEISRGVLLSGGFCQGIVYSVYCALMSYPSFSIYSEHSGELKIICI